MAYIVIPNHLVHPMFGKILFATMDILCALLIWKLLSLQIKREEFLKKIPLVDAICLLNPQTIVLSTWGSSDIIVLFLVLLTLYLVLSKKYVLGGIMFGLSVHFKIYPFIYSIPLFFFINRTHNLLKSWSYLLSPLSLFKKDRITFFLASALTFIGLGGLFYSLYGQKFIYEAYLYHSERVDHWHNFSFNYYFEYLYYSDLPENSYLTWTLGQILQFGLAALFGIMYYYDLFYVVFAQSFIFVLFNWVCTA